MKTRLLIGMAAAAAAATFSAGPALASTDVGRAVSVPNGLVTCSKFPGHYCAKIVYTSVSGGVDVNKTLSTGYTTGPGDGREWFRYSCTAGTCYIAPSPVFTYGSKDVQLNVKRTFSGSGFFLPCGARFGVDYRNPAVNAPGPGPVLFNVVCHSDGTGSL